jgi:hypothetical protein
VKGVIKKMHGLNKTQECFWDTPIVKEITNTNQAANTIEYHLHDPVTLNNLSVINNGDNIEVYPYRINFWVRFYNFGSFPVYIQTTKVAHRRDYPATVSGAPQSIIGLMQEDAPLLHNPFISPTTSNGFQKQCKITKMKTVLVPPGRSYVCKMKRRFRKSTPWTGRLQGDSSQFLVCKGEQTAIFRIWGYPGYSSGLDDLTELGHYRVHPLVYRYASWYRMDDATPTSSTSSLLPLTGTANQLRWYSQLLQQYDVPTPQLGSVSVPKGTTEFPVQTNPT